MNKRLKSILVLREHYQNELAIKPFTDHRGHIPSEVLDPDGPYLRLRVLLPCDDPQAIEAEILLPHDAVLLILIDAPDKVLGFGTHVPSNKA